jgi:hypothetical protein
MSQYLALYSRHKQQTDLLCVALRHNRIESAKWFLERYLVGLAAQRDESTQSFKNRFPVDIEAVGSQNAEGSSNRSSSMGDTPNYEWVINNPVLLQGLVREAIGAGSAEMPADAIGFLMSQPFRVTRHSEPAQAQAGQDSDKSDDEESDASGKSRLQYFTFSNAYCNRWAGLT